MTRDRIQDERKLFLAIRKELSTVNSGGPSPDRGSATPAQVHRRLREALCSGFSWLKQPAPVRVSMLERVVDFARLFFFACSVLLALSLPGLILAPIMPTDRYGVLVGGTLVLAAVPLYRLRGTLIRAWKQIVLIALFVGFYFLAVAPLAAFIAALLTGKPFTDAASDGARTVGLGLLSVPFSIAGILAWLRWLERRDSSQDAPPIDEEAMRQMAQREDWLPQNHMGSVVLIKPGVLRTIIIRAGHLGLGLVLRATATHGYLGSMRTVHFAHWAFSNNTSRLMFFSNFDQTWDSYLDDFIEKAAPGLTLAWGCGVGFPPTRFLVQDGARHGRKFKAWARHSMAISRFWYSAYPDLTVDQIERNNRIANGLRKPSLSEKEAAAWIKDL